MTARNRRGKVLLMAHIKVNGQVNGFEIVGLVTDNGTTDLGECELRYPGCTFVAELREDPYEADVNDNPGIFILMCPECAQERSDGI